MFKIIKEGEVGKRNGNGFRKLDRFPTKRIEGVCFECNARILFEGVKEDKETPASKLKETFKKKVIKQGRRFAGHGWTADCSYCGGEHTVFFMCLKTTMANNNINPDLRIIE